MKSLAVFLLLAVLFITGCGLKGPLYLPPPKADTGASKNTTDQKK